MSDHDDQDLSGPFEALRAPRSTSGYAQRQPRLTLAASGGGRRWPQALAGVLAVVVALAGAGTFLALRNARQNSTATTTAGNPPARSGAAMAWDSTAGMTVMYGGTAASGSQLHDTWLWDGSAWRQPARGGGPGPLLGSRMTDDPAAGGVLLIGMPALPMGAIGGVTACSTGTSGSGTASGSTGSGSSSAGGTPLFPLLPTTAPGSTAVVPSPSSLPPGTPTPSPARLPGVSTPPNVLPCATVVSPSVQTWLFTSQGWQRADAGADSVQPALDAQLAYDGASREVVAVATTYFACGGPMTSGATKQPLMVPCEMTPALGTSGSAASRGAASGSAGVASPQLCTASGCPTRAMPCPLSGAIYSCNWGRLSTWVWTGGRWSLQAVSGPTGVLAIAALSGAAGAHAALVDQTWMPAGLCRGAMACPPIAAGPTGLVTAAWRWSGSSWQAHASGLAQGSGLSLGGSAITGVGGVMVAVAEDGATRALDLRADTTVRAGTAPPRSGAAIAEGPSGTAVLFGGLAVDSAVAGVAMAPPTQPGSDTWRWDGHSWAHVGGIQPPVQTFPTVCPAGKACRVPPVMPSTLPAPVNPPVSASAASGPAPTGPAPSAPAIP